MSAIGKTVLSILLIVAIVGAALWILGGKQSEYSTALSIDAPPEAVFPYLTQPERLKSWTDGLSEVSELMPVEKVEGYGGAPPKKTLRVMSKADGSQVHSQDQVIRYEKNLSISVQSTSQQQVVTYIYQLEPRDGQTYLSYRIKTNSCGVGRFLAPIASNDFQERIDGDIRTLKNLVESSPHPKPAVVPVGLETSPDSIGLGGSPPDVSIPPPADGTSADEPNTDGPNAETPVTGQPFSF